MPISFAESVTSGNNTLIVEALLSSFFSCCRVKKLGLLLSWVQVLFDAQLYSARLVKGRIGSDFMSLTKVKRQLQIEVLQSKGGLTTFGYMYHPAVMCRQVLT